MRFLMKTIAFLLAVGLLLAAAALAWGHVHIRRIRPPLPEVDEILEPDASVELPVRLTWINTASQRMPRSAVLDASLDPFADQGYVMSHPSFVVEWQDGRIFLIDLGMDTATAIDFGLPLELLAGAEPIEPHVPVSSVLGENRQRVAGIGFTHMHSDHVDGITKLCSQITLDPARGRIPVFQHHYQLSQVNHTTRGPKATLREASCVETRPLGFESGLIAVPDFPGLYAIPAAGHTPGSTIWVVQLRTYPGGSEGRRNDVQTWVITGDVVNHVQAVEHDLPKPLLYSLLMVPENRERLAEVRKFLQRLWRAPGVTLLVSHDREQLEKSGLPTY